MVEINYTLLLEDIVKDIAPQYKNKPVIKQLKELTPFNKKDYFRKGNYECILGDNDIIFAVERDLYDRGHLHRFSGRNVSGRGLCGFLYKKEFIKIVVRYLDQFCKDNNIQESWLMFNQPDAFSGIQSRKKEY